MSYPVLIHMNPSVFKAFCTSYVEKPPVLNREQQKEKPNAKYDEFTLWVIKKRPVLGH